MADAQSRDRIQNGRMRMQDIRPDFAHHLEEALFNSTDQCQFAKDRQPVNAATNTGRPKEVPPFDILFHERAPDVFRCRQVKRFPTPLALLAQDRKRAERIAAMQRNRMIEDVQNPQAHETTSASSRPRTVGCCVVSRTLRKKASNISSDHKEAL
jgi:hypothetical protein